MKKIHFHIQPIPVTFGDKQCLSCSLTIAEFVNGGLYTLSSGCTAYFHHQCLPIRGRHPPHLVSIDPAMSPIKKYWR